MTELSTVDREELVDVISEAIVQEQQAVAQREVYIETRGGTKVRYASAKRGHEPLDSDAVVAISFIVGAFGFGVFALLRIT